MPEKLYHASGYWQLMLRPGFHYTGEEVFWDETESNKFLYAGEDKDFVTDMGFASVIEKSYNLESFHSDKNKIEIRLRANSAPLTVSKIKLLSIYLYEMRFKKSDKWVPVETHNTEKEWKTKNTVSYVSVKQIAGFDWIKKRDIKVIHPRL